MLEVYISGFSKRKVSNIVEQLFGTSVSKSFVSILTAELDPMVKEQLNSSLSKTEFPYVVTDVLYIKVREDNRVVSKSCHITNEINEDEYREIIDFLIQNSESESTWSNFFKHLKNRDLKGTEQIILDSHKVLVSSIREYFTVESWQRFQVHFMRNILSQLCS